MGRRRDDERDRREELDDEDSEATEEESSEEDESDDDARHDSEDTSESSEDDGGEGDEDDEEYDKPRALKTIRKQRQAVKERDKRIRELEKANKKFERKDQSRDEQLQSDLTEKDERIGELETENTELAEQVQRSSFIEKMAASGFTQRQARIAWKDRDEFDAQPEFNEKRQLTNPKAVRKAAKEFDSEFYATGSADGGNRDRKESGGEGSSGAMNDMIRGAAGRS